MIAATMYVQLRRRNECLSAVVTFVGSFASMIAATMIGQLRRRNECLAAVVTFEGSFASMNAAMYGQLRRGNECLSAVVTFERLLAGVRAMMDFEIRVVDDLLTIIALDNSILQVDRCLVGNRDELINRVQADKQPFGTVCRTTGEPSAAAADWCTLLLKNCMKD